MQRGGLRESSGPTDLLVGSVLDAESLARAGSALVGKQRLVLRKLNAQTVASTTLANCAELLFTNLKPATAYRFRYVLFYSAVSTTTGLKVAVDYTGTVTSTRYGATIPLTLATANWSAVNADAAPIVVTDSTNTLSMATIEGCIVTNSAGDLNLQIACDVAANLTVDLNSFGELWEI